MVKYHQGKAVSILTIQTIQIMEEEMAEEMAETVVTEEMAEMMVVTEIMMALVAMAITLRRSFFTIIQTISEVLRILPMPMVK